MWSSLLSGFKVFSSSPRCLFYQTRNATRNPFERRKVQQLYDTLTGGKGGRKGRGQKWGKVPWVRPKRMIELGRGAKGKRWPGLSYPLPKVKTNINPWTHRHELQPRTVQENSKEYDDINQVGVVNLNIMRGETHARKTLPELNWSAKGWSGRGWRGRYVGVPEAPDGTPLTDFHSIILDMHRVRYIKYSGKLETIYCFVVIGNTCGMFGFAGAEATTFRAAIRKAKNRAAKQLQSVPICEGHTLYHNVRSKCAKTTVNMERKVKGYGLRCNRNLQAMMKLIGIEDTRIKQIGRVNIKRLANAVVKGLLSQTTYQKLANESGKCVVQYKTELSDRPLVIAVPDDTETSFLYWLRDHQMLHPELKEVLFPVVTYDNDNDSVASL